MPARRERRIIGLGNVALHGHLPGWRARRTSRSSPSPTCGPAQRAACAERLLPARAGYDSAESLLAERAARLRRHLHAAVEPRAPDPRRARARPARALREAAGAVGRRARARGPAGPSVGPRAPHRPQLASRTDRQAHRASCCAQGRSAGSRGSCGTRSAPSPRRPAATRRATTGASTRRWRAAACSRDHGWHVCYVIQRWIGEPAAGRAGAPRDAAAHRLARRGHRDAVRLTFPTPPRRSSSRGRRTRGENWAA